VADTKITDLATKATPAAADLIVLVDPADTSLAASGTDKKATLGTLPIAANVGRSSSGNLVLAAQSTPGSLADGELYQGTQKTLSAQVNGLTHRFVGCLFAQTADATITNSTAEAALTGSGVGTLTLPANFLLPGKTLRVTARGIYSTAASGTGTLAHNLKLGATTVLAFGPTGLNTGLTNRVWVLEALLTCRTAGGSGTLAVQGDLRLNISAVAWGAEPGSNAAAVTVDTTATLAISLTAAFSVANAANSLTMTNFTVEVLN
jgi:hypothetical protein